MAMSNGKLNVSLVGIDGAGKGTYIDMLTDDLDKNSLSYKICYLGFSAYQLGILKRIARMKIRYTGYFSRKVLMIVYMSLLPFELLYRRGLGKFDVLIMDRHPLFEPFFSNRFLSLYDKLLCLIAPTPHLILYLTGDPATIWKRKMEIPWLEFDEKSRGFDKLAIRNQRVCRIVRVLTDIEKEKAFLEIRKIVSEYQ